jgi:predicted RNA-binding Zn-ribbon protein involved in translation (DUF1610 family)
MARKRTKPGQILQKNSAYKTCDAKIFIIKNNIIPYKCIQCGNEGFWQGKKLKLELHHKDGDRTNHSIENLEFRCPNCHSITDSDGCLKKTEINKDELNKLVLEGKNFADICRELKIPQDGSSFYKLKTAIKNAGVVQ